jgi:quercetin dioxygenase-like cupin family protein
VRSQLGGEAEAKIYEAGQSWYEPPGAHHVVAANASDSEPARLLAVLIGDDGDALVTTDQR